MRQKAWEAKKGKMEFKKLEHLLNSVDQFCNSEAVTNWRWNSFVSNITGASFYLAFRYKKIVTTFYKKPVRAYIRQSKTNSR